MHKQTSSAPAYIALVLAVLAAIFSTPSMAKNLQSELLSLLQTQGAADAPAPGSMEALNQLGLP